MSKKISGAEYSLDKIFNSDFEFHIPPYQRPYAWTFEQSSELFEDLYDFSTTDDDESYFLGSIVIIKEEGKAYSEVIDGQQRLTTLTILFAAIASKFSNNKDRSDELRKRIIEPGDEFSNRKTTPRLTLRERDRDFFKKYIQENDTLDALLELEAGSLENESQRNIQANARYFINRINEEFVDNKKDLLSFVQFLLNRCYLVTVSTSNQKSAFRVFSVMNNRGLELRAADIIKADIVGKIQTEQPKYEQMWEDMEVELGRTSFNDFFSYIRMIFAKEKAKKSILEEFRMHVLQDRNPQEILLNVLQPYAKALIKINNASYDVFNDSHKEQINDYLKWLNKIDNSDWKPVAILFLNKHKNNSDYICWFFKKLERLAAYLHISAKNPNQRINRYSAIIKKIENNSNKESLGITIDLKPKEVVDMEQNLSADIYNYPSKRRNHIILRLDSFMSDGGASYSRKILTIEHVLPQNIPIDSQWKKSWTKTEQQQWVHKLANLIPLNKYKNFQAQNYDFEKKKNIYFVGNDRTSSYALTTQILAINDWTPQILEKRQRELLQVFAKNWELDFKINQNKIISVPPIITPTISTSATPSPTPADDNIKYKSTYNHLSVHEPIPTLATNDNRKYPKATSLSQAEYSTDETITINGILLKLPSNIGGDFQKDFRVLLNTLFTYNLLPEEEINNLYNKEHSERMLGIELPLFSTERFINEKSRYWNTKIGNHYVCSQWWRQRFRTYRNCILKNWFPHLKRINTN